jgi:hypothetical protein
MDLPRGPTYAGTYQNYADAAWPEPKATSTRVPCGAWSLLRLQLVLPVLPDKFLTDNPAGQM